jgi:endonuclease YncB( thermonuclease family)
VARFKLKLNSFVVILTVAVFAGGIAGYFLSQRFYQPKETREFGPASRLYQVVEVIDGDTIKAKIGDKAETIRLLGINTPEVENPYRHQECFGPEASKKTKKLLTGKKVYLLPDPKAPNRGKYNRLLRYIFLPNGEFVNAELIRDGYAFKYIYQPIQFMDYFNFLEQEARENRLGLWSGKCDYFSKSKK